jgi:hypothetical protein
MTFGRMALVGVLPSPFSPASHALSLPCSDILYFIHVVIY